MVAVARLSFMLSRFRVIPQHKYILCNGGLTQNCTIKSIGSNDVIKPCAVRAGFYLPCVYNCLAMAEAVDGTSSRPRGEESAEEVFVGTDSVKGTSKLWAGVHHEEEENNKFSSVP